MSNEKFRDIKVGDKVFVYCHKDSYTKIREVVVSQIKAEFDYPPNDFQCSKVRGLTMSFFTKGYATENNTFYIQLNEEKSRRGTNYTGFLTYEDAFEMAKEIHDQEVRNLNNQIEDMNKTFERLKQNKDE